jgi:protein-disulfide isomerase
MSNTSKQSRAKARERLAAERAAQAAAAKRRERALRIGLVILVIAIVAGITTAVVVSRRGSTATAGAVPAGVTATKGYPTGTAKKPVVDMWEDFQCPNCRDFEAANRTTIENLAKDGKAQIVYHTWNFLDADNTSNAPATQNSSTRAAMAAACASDQGKFLAMHDQIFENQPAKEGTGYTNQTLEGFAKAAGVPNMSTFDQCLTSKKYLGFVNSVAAEADNLQITGTPTVFVDGKQVDFSSANSWAQYGQLIVDAVTAAT